MAENSGGYIGNKPSDSSVTIARQAYTTTGITTDFTFRSGYTPGYLDAYLNGVRLIETDDYVATDGTTLSLSTAAQEGDTLELIAYKAFNVSEFTLETELGGNFNVSNNLTVGGNINLEGNLDLQDGDKILLGTGDDLQIYHDGGTNYIEDAGVGNLHLKTNGSEIRIEGSSASLARFFNDASVELHHNGSKKIETTTTGISVTGNLDVSNHINLLGDLDMGDSDFIRLGADDDLLIYHDGNNSAINDVGIGNLYIQGSDSIYFRDYDTSENHMVLNKNGSVDLYHNGTKKLETTSTGVKLPDNQKVELGDGSDLQIWSDNTDQYIRGEQNQLILRSNNLKLQSYLGENYIQCANNNDVSLFYDNSKKFETTTTGAKVTGALEVTQEYPSIRPTLDLNFAATKTLDRRITFRRDSIGTFTGEDGLVKYASNNVPRFDHDPTTRESLGLLIEESRTNLAEYGTIVGDTGWYNRPAFNTTLNDSVAPDGRTTATKITNLNAESDADLYSFEQYAIGSNKTITHSIYIKSPDATNVGKEIHFRGKRISGTSSSWSQKFILTAEWQRVTVTHTYQADNTTGRAYIGSDPNGSNPAGEATACLFWGLQVEEGSFATSFIPTYGSTVTRAVDTAKITGTNFTDFYNQTEGTFFVEADTINSLYNDAITGFPGANNNYTIIGTGASPNRFQLRFDDTEPFQVLAFGPNSTTAITTGVSLTPTLRAKIAGAIKQNDVRGAAQGEIILTDTSFDMISPTSLFIGSLDGSSEILPGHVRKVSYYRQALPNAQLQGLTQQ